MADHERIEFRDKLREFMGSNHTYFCPPETVKLVYPCAIYKLSDPFVRHADNNPYRYKDCYEVTFISKDPEWIHPESVLRVFDFCKFDRAFMNDQLYHWVFRIFY